MKTLIFAIVNQKGGVGKTTTAQALGIGMRAKGKAVLFVDLDQQGNLSYAMHADPGHVGMGEVLLGQAEAAQAIQHLPQGDLLGSSPLLAAADIHIDGDGREYRLKEALAPLLSAYNIIVIDTPPSLGILSINALTAATDVIIPVHPDIFSLQGVGQLSTTYQAVKEHTNPGLRVRGLLLTRYSDRVVLSRDIKKMAKKAAKSLDSVVFEASIREGVSVREAQISQEDLFSYDGKSKVAKDYRKFVEEVGE